MPDERIVGWNKAAAITPSDTLDLNPACQAIYVGGAGNVTVLTDDGTSVLFTAPVVGGAPIPIKAKRVMSTGTTATALVALWEV